MPRQLKPKLATPFTFLSLLFFILFLSACAASAGAPHTANPSPTETPTAYWNDFPKEKRGYFETDEARRIDALKSPEPPPPPTFPPMTDEPIVLHGEPAGDGVLFWAGGYPNLDIRSPGWGIQIGEWTYTVLVGGNREFYGEEVKDDQGILLLFSRLTKGNIGDVKTDHYYTPEKTGKLKIIGAEGRTLQLESDNGVKYEFDVLKPEIVRK